LSPLVSLPTSIQSDISLASSAILGAIPTIASVVGAAESAISAGEPSIPVKWSQYWDVLLSLGTKQACYERTGGSQCQKLLVNLVDFIPGALDLFGSSLEKLQDVENLLVYGCLGSIYYALPIGLICMCLSMVAVFLIERNMLIIGRVWRAIFLLFLAVIAFICILILMVLVSQLLGILQTVTGELGSISSQVI
jgi:ABC-type dipeptide/oligopeptide/nickel transport system permease component